MSGKSQTPQRRKPSVFPLPPEAHTELPLLIGNVMQYTLIIIIAIVIPVIIALRLLVNLTDTSLFQLA
jgi:hypothetical protein